ncbi:MAG: hypothetical protein H8F28_03245 [Fibrella sp.]|nr:hypothetical protein [Armatimonadota bacterium]
MSNFSNIFSRPTVSVPSVSTKDDAGEEYKHAIEPELAFGNIPRLARLTAHTLTMRRLLWNVALVTLGLFAFFGQRDVATWDALIKSGWTSPGIIDEVSRYGDHESVSFHFKTDLGMSYGEGYYHKDNRTIPSISGIVTVTFLPEKRGKIWQLGEATPERRNDRLRLWIISGLGTLGLFAATIAVFEERWKRQLHLLREGVAVHGLVRSGAVIDSVKPNQFRIRYTYWVGTGQNAAGVNVSEEQYRELTEGNPYLTVLYDVTDPSVSKPYFQCGAAYLVTK